METKRTMKADGSYTEVSNSHQNSLEISQTSKGEWYVKSVKIYESDPQMQTILLRESTRVARERVDAENKAQ